MKLTTICLKLRFRTSYSLPLKERVKSIKVPHKNRANDTCEIQWKFGRYMCQLKRLTFNYCPNNGDSRGLRCVKFVNLFLFVCVFGRGGGSLVSKLVSFKTFWTMFIPQYHFSKFRGICIY